MPGRIRTNLRIRLIASMMTIVIITGVTSIIIGYKIINRNIVSQAYDVLQRDMDTAAYIYYRNIVSINHLLEHVASFSSLSEAVYNKKRATIQRILHDVKQRRELEIINVTDAHGRILARSRNSGLHGDDVSSDLCVRSVLDSRTASYGSVVIKKDLLKREGLDMVRQVAIELIPTPHARPLDKRFEERALAQEAAYPLFHNGIFVGVIYAAKILNKDNQMVDKIKNLVFKDEKIGGFELGTVTIFLDDLRISTNVKREDGSRTIGTRVSEVVYNKTYIQGQVWLDKAFVVNNWYLAAYNPIYNVVGAVVGILYVGVLEEKYLQIERTTTTFFLVMSLLTAAIAIMLSMYLIRYIIQPINTLVAASRDVASGNFNQKIDISYDGEIGKLINTFNKMVDAIGERDRQLKEHTQKQILQSEKLASLGRLASGIAHEINNPLTGILTYSSLLKEDLGNSEYAEDLDVIVSETMRCRNIVRGILDFARETKLEKEPVVLNTIINESLAILENHVNFQNITIIKELADNMPQTNLDINQMKSVINNLCMNSADAMPGGGSLTITTYYNKEKGVIVMQVSDNGSGIDEQNLNKIFDPFFTTKETGKGTGLGLAVIYGIIERHGGYIDVKSKVGEGTTFTIELPVN